MKYFWLTLLFISVWFVSLYLITFLPDAKFWNAIDIKYNIPLIFMGSNNPPFTLFTFIHLLLGLPLFLYSMHHLIRIGEKLRLYEKNK